MIKINSNPSSIQLQILFTLKLNNIHNLPCSTKIFIEIDFIRTILFLWQYSIRETIYLSYTIDRYHNIK